MTIKNSSQNAAGIDTIFSRFDPRFLLAVLVGFVLTVSPFVVAQDSIADPKRFESAIVAFEAADREQQPAADSTLFVGASNIRLWTSLPTRFQPQKVINRGFGGAHLSDVVFYADRIVLPYSPKSIYLNAGGNDLHAGKRPELVAAHFEEFVQKVRSSLPQASLAFISIPPSPSRWSEAEQVKKANRLIADFAAKDGKIEFIDVFPLLLDEQGQPKADYYIADRLHFSELGYDVVTSAIRWQKAILNLQKKDHETQPPANPILFIGSSSIVRWKSLAADFPDMPVLNHGFGGSEVFDSVTYAQQLVVRYRPRMVVMYAGGNDIHRGKTPERVAADCRAFAARVHTSLPQTRIAFISIAGNPARWSEVERVRAANALIESFTKSDERLAFIDVHSRMLGADGQPLPDIFVDDRLHMNENGYAIWKEVVRPYLNMGANAAP